MQLHITPPDSKPYYRPEIDGLRAFAVIAVIVNHFNKELLPNGYLGVDAFFVISGYVITSSLAKGRNSFNEFMGQFYVRRVKRLIPALVAFIIITSVLTCLFNPDPGRSLITAIAAIFGFSNIYLFSLSTDYFSESTELNPFIHTWSLGVEEQFYLIFPFIVWFSGVGRNTDKGSRYLFFLLLPLASASLIAFIILSRTNQSASYLLSPGRFWEIAIGSLIFLFFKSPKKVANLSRKFPPLLSFLLVLGVTLFPFGETVPSTIAVVLLTAILVATITEGSLVYKLLTLPLVVYTGVISYSLYLWHWPILSLSRWTIGIRWWTIPFQVLLICVLAHLSYKFVECPFRFAKWRLSTPFIIASFALAMIVSASFIAALGLRLKAYLYSGTKNAKLNIVLAGQRRRVILLGDSTAYDLSRILARDSAAEVLDCSRIATRPWEPGPYRFRQCSYMLANGFKDGDLLIIASLPDVSPFSSTRLAEYASKVLTHSSGSDTQVVLRIPYPSIPAITIPSDICQREWFRPIVSPNCFTHSLISKDFLLGKGRLLNILRPLKEKGLIVWDVSSVLCPSGVYCASHDTVSPIRIDRIHLFHNSPRLSRRLIESLNATLNGVHGFYRMKGAQLVESSSRP